MNILNETTELISLLGFPVETGVFSQAAPASYIVLVPLADSFPLSADNQPLTDSQELRITIFSKGNYLPVKNKIVKQMLGNDFYITDRRYNGYDKDVGYHQYSIDVAKNYEIDTEE